MEPTPQYTPAETQDHIQDKSNDHAYFSMAPNMLDDLLDPYQYRLYGHIKRVCGESGECWQSTRTMAEKCKMSTGKVSEAKGELQEMGLITIKQCKRKNGGLPYHLITIVDIWKRNIEWCLSSPDERPSSPSEQASSPGETKKTPPEEDPINKNRSTATPSTDVDLPPINLNGWLEKLKEPKCNRTATLRWMITTHFPDILEVDLPSFGKVGRVAKRLHAGRLAQLIWQFSGTRITGCVLDYLQAVHKGVSYRENRDNGTQANPDLAAQINGYLKQRGAAIATT